MPWQDHSRLNQEEVLFQLTKLLQKWESIVEEEVALGYPKLALHNKDICVALKDAITLLKREK